VIHRHISIANHHPHLRIERRAIARVIRILDTQGARFRGGCPSGELSLVFLTDAALAKLHADFLGDPTPTDVITFSGEPAADLAGEICVSVDAALRRTAPSLASTRGRVGRRALTTSRLAAFSAELTLYLVHGWLHLAGYDDLVPAKKRLMRRSETRAMTLLSAKKLVPGFSLR